MKRIRLESILLFILVLPFILNYRISWLDTPYWLFGIIFLLLLLNVAVDVFWGKEKTYEKCKNILLAVITSVVILSAFVSAIIVRHQTSPVYMIHDIIVQQEAAINFLTHRINPYSADYFKTPLVNWPYSDTQVNPALYYFVMEPFYLLFALPFYVISNHTIGFFDGRIPLLFLFLSSLIFAWKIPKEQKHKRLFVALLAFNPVVLSYTLEGRSDMFMFAFLIASLFFLQKNKWYTSSFLMALAFAIKQSVWPIFPFYIAYLFWKTNDRKKVMKTFGIFALTFLIIVLPFFFWNPKAFIDSTIFYLSGNILHGYPVSGYGFSMILHQAGVIKDINSYYPFAIWQIILGIPLLVFLLLFLRKKLTIANMMMSYGMFLFVFWYFSRYFNNSHIAYISVILVTAYFFSLDDK